MTPDGLVELFARVRPSARPRSNDAAGPARGDHDLNPGFDVAGPLTPAAVLVPLIARDPGMTVMLTRRTPHLNHHGGQIAFPGGHVEDGDGRAEETALRETEEEVGLDRRHVKIIGRLDDYIVRTGFLVTPVVGLVTPPFKIEADAREVDEVFEVPLDFILDAANHQRDHRIIDGVERHFYAIHYGEYYIWGATAGMLRNLYELAAA